MKNQKLAIGSRVLGALYGFAIGDAMGITTELMASEDVQAKFGPLYGRVEDILGGGYGHVLPGSVTDKTQTMICIINALTKRPRPKSVQQFAQLSKQELIQWWQTGPREYTSTHYESMSYYLSGYDKIPEGKFDKDSTSLVRALPCALANNLKWNIAQGRLTNNNDHCSNAIETYHHWVQLTLQGDDLPINQDIERAMNPMDPTLDPTNVLYNVMYHLVHNHSFDAAVIDAVNNGGWSSTIAALTGGLAGAMYGVDNIPKRWINQLDVLVRLRLVEFKNFLIS